MSQFERYFKRNSKNLIFKWSHYFEIYEKHFNRFKNKDIVLVEVGIYNGGSLQMWQDYFGSNARIYGIDIDERCKQFEQDNIKIFIGSQADREFLRDLKNKIPKIDILIDDGGHFMSQQIILFEELFDHMGEDGVYLCEDTHTSYMLKYGGGYKRNGTFIEYTKNLIDQLNAYHSEQLKKLTINKFTESVQSIHYYDKVFVIERRRKEKPLIISSGNKILKESFEVKLYKPSLRKRLLKLINVVLRYLNIKSFRWY
tara:strand:+ start:342 stop:1109 length:768 start_codon:yes stop_codon:yes gene_type:complete